MLTVLMFLAACQADTAAPDDFSDPDSLVPTVDELKEEIEQAGDPQVDATQDEAIYVIEAIHGKDAVEEIRQRLLEEKAAELHRELRAQEEAEQRAKAEAVAKAEAEAAKLKAKVDQAADEK